MPEVGATYLPAAGSTGLANIATGCATCTAFSAAATIYSFNSFQTALSSSCKTITKLSIFREGSPFVGVRCTLLWQLCRPMHDDPASVPPARALGSMHELKPLLPVDLPFLPGPGMPFWSTWPLQPLD